MAKKADKNPFFIYFAALIDWRMKEYSSPRGYCNIRIYHQDKTMLEKVKAMLHENGFKSCSISSNETSNSLVIGKRSEIERLMKSCQEFCITGKAEEILELCKFHPGKDDGKSEEKS